MEAYPLLVDFLTILAVSIPVSFLFHRLRLPAIAGFLATGAIVGPFGAGFISDTGAVRALAEIGVVLLLFTIGLEFSIRHLLSSGPRIFLIAAGQVFLTIAVTALVAERYLPLHQAVFLGFLFSLSSTAIVLKIYSDRAEVDTPYGKISVAILLFQDLCIIPMMLIVPTLAAGSIDFLRIGKQMILAVVALGVLYLAARYLVPLLLGQVVQIRNRDVFLVTILFICLGTAYASASMGLSLAIGAFVAGLVISESTYSHQILSDILPFRNTFNAIFFISIGMLWNFPEIWRHWQIPLGTAALIIGGKALLLFLVLLFAKQPFRVSWIAALSLAQVGEFSFLLAEQGRSFFLLPDSIYQFFLASSVITMFVTPFAIMIAGPTAIQLHKIFFAKRKWEEEEQQAERKGHLLIIGFGLNGKNLSRVVREIGIPFLVIELNDKLVKEAQSHEIPVLFGDATTIEVLKKAGAAQARMAVIAISDAAATRRCASILRSLNPSAVILVRTRYVAEVEFLEKLGANLVIPEEFETSIEIFSRVLEQYRIPDHLIQQQISIIRSDSYGMLRGLSLSHERLQKISELFLKSTVQQIVISNHSPAKDRTVRQLNLRSRTGATILVALRGDEAITNPDSDFLIRENDILVLWGAHQQLADATAILDTKEIDRTKG